MNYSKLVKNYIRFLKRKTGYVLAESDEKKQNFINEGLNALYIALKEINPFIDFNALEKTLINLGYTKLLINPSIYKVRSAKQFLSFNMGMLD